MFSRLLQCHVPGQCEHVAGARGWEWGRHRWAPAYFHTAFLFVPVSRDDVEGLLLMEEEGHSDLISFQPTDSDIPSFLEDCNRVRLFPCPPYAVSVIDKDIALKELLLLISLVCSLVNALLDISHVSIQDRPAQVVRVCSLCHPFLISFLRDLH